MSFGATLKMAALTTDPRAPDDDKLRSGNADLAARAAHLGVSYLLPCASTLSQDVRAQLVPVAAARRLQKQGFDVIGFSNFHFHLNKKKMTTVPDVQTLTRLPWDREIGWVICDFSPGGVPYQNCPRRTLMKIIERVREAGFVTKCGIEMEFSLMKKDSFEVLDPSDPPEGCIGTVMDHRRFMKRILSYMTELGWNPYMMEREHNSCQLEVNFDPADALVTADRFTFAKFMIKEIAKEEGYRASFMPAIDMNDPVGNGGHINVSLWRSETNAFHDPSGDLSLSETGRHFLSGVLQNAAGMCALVCPTVNSYKRLYLNANTYNTISYSDQSLSVAARSQNGERIELRFPDGSMNPYLALAAVFSAGLDGILQKSPLDAKLRMDDDVYLLPPITTRPKLPLHLEDALRHLQENATMNEYLGKAFVDDYVKLKQRQWRQYLACLTEWEKQFVDSY